MLSLWKLEDGACYISEETRFYVVWSMLCYSSKMFWGCEMIKKLDGAKSLSDKAFVEGDPDAYSHLLDLYQKIESPLLDAIRIIVCFENYFKAMLLFENYAIHQMDLRVCREHFPQFLTGVNQKNLLQKTTPISLIDIKRAENHDLAWSVQSFRSLNNQTIQFSTLIKQPKYREVYSKGKEIDNQLFPLLAMLNETRNSLHLLNVEYVASGGIPVDSFLFLRDYVSAHIDAFGEEFYKGSESLIRTGKMLIETLDPEQL
jgi:hypothetical protein